MLLFMGGSRLHTALFLVSMAVAIMALFFGINNKVWLTAGSVLVLIFSMIIMRDMVRTAYLRPFFDVSELEVTHQYSPMIFFLVSLVVGIGIVGYIIRLALKPHYQLEKE